MNVLSPPWPSRRLAPRVVLSASDTGVVGRPIYGTNNPWIKLYCSDPRAVARVRKLTKPCGDAVQQASALRERLALEKAVRGYGARAIVATIAGPRL